MEKQKTNKKRLAVVDAAVFVYAYNVYILLCRRAAVPPLLFRYARALFTATRSSCY